MAGSEIISIRDIDFSHDEYKISRHYIPEELKKSVEVFGLLELPVLLKQNGLLVILFGHNRLELIRSAGKKSFAGIITEKIVPDDFIRSILLKNFKGELGPVGKIKTLRIARNVLEIDNDRLIKIFRQGLGLDLNYFFDEELLDRVYEFPPPLKRYLDMKNAGIKDIKTLLLLPRDALVIIVTWIERFDIRINIFRHVLDYLIDIGKRDGSFDHVPRLIENQKKKRHDELLQDRIFKIRYPEYSKLKDRADDIIEDFKKDGFDLALPPYFESNDFSLTLTFNKNETREAIQKKLERIDPDKIENISRLF